MAPDTAIRFHGRFLFLSQDPQVVLRQLAGEDVRIDEALPLRENVSTDEISPTWVTYHYDETLGEHPYAGLTCGGLMPVATGAVKRGGFGITVAGGAMARGRRARRAPTRSGARGSAW